MIGLPNDNYAINNELRQVNAGTAVKKYGLLETQPHYQLHILEVIRNFLTFVERRAQCFQWNILFPDDTTDFKQYKEKQTQLTITSYRVTSRYYAAPKILKDQILSFLSW